MSRRTTTSAQRYARALAPAYMLVALLLISLPAHAEDTPKPKAAPPPAAAKSTSIKIIEPFARLQPPTSRMTGAFMVLENQGKQADALIGASCDCAQTVELHVMNEIDGRMSMRKTARFDLAPGQRFALASGGPHLMLIDLTKPLATDQPLHLKLRFEKAGEIQVTVPVRDPRRPS